MRGIVHKRKLESEKAYTRVALQTRRLCPTETFKIKTARCLQRPRFHPNINIFPPTFKQSRFQAWKSLQNEEFYDSPPPLPFANLSRHLCFLKISSWRNSHSWAEKHNPSGAKLRSVRGKENEICDFTKSEVLFKMVSL